jgi:hypothetical protein
MKKKLIITVSLLIAILCIMLLTKPSEASFSDWAKEKYINIDASERSLVQIMVKNTTCLQIEMTRKYHNYYLFATVDASLYGKDITYLGILGNWFIVKKQ